MKTFSFGHLTFTESPHRPWPDEGDLIAKRLPSSKFTDLFYRRADGALVYLTTAKP